MANGFDTSRGYGPGKSLHFSGEAEHFELWSIKFKAYLRLHKLHKVLTTPEEGDEEKNAELYAMLVQVLDDKSLNLIIRDAIDDGRKAYEILHAHYEGTSKPKIISLWCELTSLKKNKEESVTEYMLRAEKSAARLKQAEETVSDGLLIAMVMKGLPDSYKAFCTIITQADSDKMDFAKFKTSLRAYEESENARDQYNESNKDDVFQMNCFQCGKPGHMKKNCTSQPNKNTCQNRSNRRQRWYKFCKTGTHDTEYCRFRKKIQSSINVNQDQEEEEDYFVFKLSVYEEDVVCTATEEDLLLVDCGATSHIVPDPNAFINRDKNFNSHSHIIELTDASKKQGLATMRGDAAVFIKDTKNQSIKVILKGALCVPSYKQIIVSVQGLTENNVKVLFSKEKNCLKLPDETMFNILKRGKLFYLHGSTTTPLDKVKKLELKFLQAWHETLGHWNVSDISKLEECCEGMRITEANKFKCDTCVQAKMTQQISRQPDPKANKILELV